MNSRLRWVKQAWSFHFNKLRFLLLVNIESDNGESIIFAGSSTRSAEVGP